MIAEKQLHEEYLDWINNYLTIEAFANNRGLMIPEAAMLIEIGKSIHERLARV